MFQIRKPRKMNKRKLDVICSPGTYKRISFDEEYQQNVVDEIAGDSFEEVVFTQSEDDFLYPHQEFHVENEVITCTNDDEGTGKSVWIEPAVKFLISKVKELRPKVGKSASLKNKKQMWIKISEELCSLGYNFNSQQVETKYFSLERKYKRTQLYNSKTGRNRQTCPYQSELDDLLQEKKSINPDFVLDSEAEVSSADLKLIEGPNLSETDPCSSSSRKRKTALQQFIDMSEEHAKKREESDAILQQTLEQSMKQREERAERKEALEKKKVDLLETLVNILKK
ncbi:uncharacterized protein LOC142234040 [Haematobia irritans]|uniref:uncharacterized protein LOC142226948 n=1 Tax=Haematobia irritans TaxID=7368 RepID=UPI003F4F466E